MERGIVSSRKVDSRMTCWPFIPTSSVRRPQCQCGQVRKESHVVRPSEGDERSVHCGLCCTVHGSGERVMAPLAVQSELVFEKGSL